MIGSRTGQPQTPPQPDSKYIIEAIHAELRDAHDNRLWLSASLRQMKAEAEGELARLHGAISAAMSAIPDPADRQRISDMVNPEQQPASPEAPPQQAAPEVAPQPVG